MRPPCHLPRLTGGNVQSAKKRTRGRRLLERPPASDPFSLAVNACAEPALSMGRLNRSRRASALLKAFGLQRNVNAAAHP
jgi:hypothetical protein